MNLAFWRAIIRYAGVFPGLSLLLAAAFFAGVLNKPAAAAGLTWNGGNGTLAPSDSSGTWDTGTNWWNGAPGASWTDGSDALFGAGASNGAAGTVTIGAMVSPNSITFAPTGDGGAYTINGGQINVGSGNLPVTVNNNATIASQLMGAGGLTVGGNSVLTLQSAAAYAGPTIISSGTLQMGTQLPNAYASGSVAHYTFDGNTNDSSGNANNGTFNGTPNVPTYTAGQFGQAIALNGNQSVVVPNSTSLQLSNSFTVSGWFNLNSAGTGSTLNGIVGTRFNQENTFDVKVDGPDQLIHGDVGNGGAWITTGLDIDNLSFAAGQWHMVTYVVTPTGAQLYFDGVDKQNYTWASATPTFMTAAGAAQMQIGDSFGGEYMNGAIDDVLVYPSALTAAQVQSVYLVEAAALPGATTLSVSAGATWNINGGAQTVGGLAGAGNVALGSGGALTVNTVGGSTFSGVISGSGTGGSFTVSGSGTLGLAGTNTYAGLISLSGGTLQLLNSAAIGSSTLDLAGGSVVFDSSVASRAFSVAGLTGSGSLALQDSAGTPDPVTLSVGGNGASSTYAGLLSGAGTLNKVGAGTLALSTSSNFSGGILVGGGTLNFANGALGSSTVSFTGGTLQSAAGSNQAIGANIINSTAAIALDTNGGTVSVSNVGGTNTGGLTKIGAGTLLLAGNDGYHGPTTISGGTLTTTGNLPAATDVNLTAAGAALNLGGSTQTIGSLSGVAGSSVIDSGTLISGNDNTSATFAGVISGSGSLSKIGTGLMCLSAPNTYTGATAVSGGTLEIGSGTSDGSIAASSSMVDNATVVYNLLGGQSFSGVIGGSGVLVKSGTGMLTLAASNSYSGGTQLAAGTLNFGNPAGLGSGTTTFAGNATLQAGVAGTVANDIAINPGITGTLDTQANAVTLSGIISGTGTLTKVGPGALTLAASNTYSGPITISAGSLLLSGAGNNNIPAASPVTVLSGGTLGVAGLAGGGGLTLAAGQTLRGTGTVVGPVTVAAGSLLSSGTGNATGTGIGMLGLNGNVSFASGGTLAAYLGTPGTSSLSSGNAGLINIQGNLTLPASGLTVSLLNNSGAGGFGSLGSGYYELFAYTGTLSGSTASTFTAPGKQVVVTNQINEPAAPNQIDVQVVSVVNFNWTGVNSGGAANSSWDTTQTSTNWYNSTTGTAAYYQDGANVTFSDSNSVTGGTVSNAKVVIQASGVQPNLVTFNNNAVNYTLSNSSGTVGIAGTTGIVKSGSGTVFLQSANSFQGPVAVNGGILNISNAAALGVSSSVSVASGASLQLQGGLALSAMPLSLAGSGTTASPAALDSLSGTNSWAGLVTLSGSSTIAAAAGQLTLAGGVNNGGYPLRIGGAGTINVPNISGSGGLTIGPGTTLNLAGTMSASTNLTDSGTLNLFAGPSLNGVLIVAAGGTVASGSAGLNVAVGGTGTLVTAGTISSAANTTIGSGAAGTGTVYQTGGLVSQGGSGSGFYLGAASGSGAYTISGGTLTANAASNVYLGGASAGAPGTPGPGTAVLNLNGGLVQALGALAMGNGTATINLNSGTLHVPALSGSSNTAVNFNGGTLQASASSASFLGATPAANVNVYYGGVVIDTQGNNIAITQSLLGVSNSGLSSASIQRADNTTVFATPPPVIVSGGAGSGGGAAYATLNSAGHINGIVITDPGSYSSPPNMTVGGSTIRLSPVLTLNGSGGLTKYGAGTLALGGINTYGGPTVINAGTLQMIGAGQLPGSTALSLAKTATLDLDGTSQQVATLADGSGGGGTVTNSSGGSNVTLALAAPENAATTFSGTIQNGAGIVNVAFEGNFISSLLLSGVNTFTGTASLGLGTVVLGNSGALSDATLYAPAGTTMVVFSPSVVPHAFTLGGLSGSVGLPLADSASNPLALTVGGNGQSSTYTGALSGGGSFTKVGAGALTLGGSNSYTGGTAVNGGDLSLAGSAALPRTGNITFGGGTLQFSASNTVDYSSQITSSTSSIALDTNGQVVTLNGGLAASNTAGLTKLGAGTLAMNGANFFGGPLDINGGELNLGTSAALPASALITFGGGALEYTAGNLTDYSGRIKNSASPIAIDTGGQNVTFAGVLDGSNSGGLTKLGAGTLALGGNNAYSGATTLVAGVLQLQKQAGVPETSALSVSGGTFDLNGYSNNLNVISASALSGGLITSQAAGKAVVLNLSLAPATPAELSLGTALSNGKGTLTLAVSSGNGSGLLVTGTNTFGGGTNINGTYVQMGNASALGTGTITISNSGYVELSWSSGPATVPNGFALNSAAIYAEGGYGTYTLTGPIALTTNSALDGTAGNNLVAAGPISGAGGLFKGIPGGPTAGDVLTLTNTANSYQGGTTILSGALAITADAVLGTGNSITFAGTAASTLQAAANNVVLGANRQITISAPAATLNAQNYTFTIAGSIGGTGALTLTGGSAGVLTLGGDNGYGGAANINGGLVVFSGANSYQGVTNINGGTLSLNNPAAIPSGGTISFGGGTLQYTANTVIGGAPIDYSGQIFNSTAPISIDTNGQTVTFSNYSLDVSNTGGLNKRGAGTLILGTNNNYTGATTINGGTLNVNNFSALPTNGIVTFRGGTLQYGLVSGNVDYSNFIKNSTGPISIDTSQTGGQNVIFANTLDNSNSGGLTKIGAGTLVLTNVNTYGGPTVIQGGTLQLQTQNVFSPGLNPNPISFTSDANSGIASNAYTEALAFNQAGTLSINGATFTGVPYPGAATPPQGTGILGSSWAFTPIAHATGGGFVAGFQPAAGQATYNMLSNSFYEGTDVNPTGTVTLTVSGLVPGQNYDARVYYRAYGNDTDSRTADFTFSSGVTSLSGTYNEDQGALTGTGETISTGNYIDFQYTAGTNGVLTITESNDATMIAGGSWHWYAFSNQLLPSSTNVLPTVTNVSIAASATLDLGGVSQQVAGLSDYNPGAGVGSIINSYFGSAGTLTLSPSGVSRFGGTIAGGAGTIELVMNGPGTQILSGANTYSGGTTIYGGVLQFANTGAMPPSGMVIVGSGATLAVNAGGPNQFTKGTSGNGTIGGLLAGLGGQAGSTVGWNSGANLGIDTTNASGGTLTYGGDIANPGGNTLGLVKLGANTLVLSGTNTYTGGTTVLNGTLVLTNNEALADGTSLTVGGDLAAFDSSSAVASPLALSAASPTAQAVPEPGTLALLAGGLVTGFGVWRRRKGIRTQC